MTRWAGVDVGGRRKGFHAAVVDDCRVVAGPLRLASVDAGVAWLTGHGVTLVAVDSPRSPAPDGCRSRDGERLLAKAICGIRYTPSLDVLCAGNPYYEWIVHGLELYVALAAAGIETIECFPTASWTRWSGPRGRVRRAAWTRTALLELRLADLPPRLGQDGRDAIAAAVTARLFAAGLTESFGEIVVPGSAPRSGRR